jgi:hypothetical protein
MIYNIFPNFAAMKEAEQYDHLFQKAQDLANVTGVSISTIRELNLHIQDENGVFPIDAYIAENNIEIEFHEIYEHAKKIWRLTNAWAIGYGYENSFVYRKDHSDRTYDLIEINDQSLLKSLDDNGNVIVFEQITFN